MTKQEAFNQAEQDYVHAKAATIVIYKELLALKDVYNRARDAETRARDTYYAFNTPYRTPDEFRIVEDYIALMAKKGLDG